MEGLDNPVGVFRRSMNEEVEIAGEARLRVKGERVLSVAGV